MQKPYFKMKSGILSLTDENYDKCRKVINSVRRIMITYVCVDMFDSTLALLLITVLPFLNSYCE